MKNKVLLVFLAMVLMISLIAASCAKPAPAPAPKPAPPPTPAPALKPVPPPPPPPAPEKEFHWKIQNAFGATDSAYYIFTEGVAQLVEEGSGGQIKCETFPGGALVGSEEIFSATQKAAIEAGTHMSSSVAGIIPSAVTMQLPTSARDFREQYELIYDLGLIDKVRPAFAKHKVHLLAMGYAGALSFQSTFPVHTLDDLKGKKAWQNAVLVDGMKELGIVPTFIPGFDMYTALKLGTLDGLCWTLVELESAKYKEVVKYLLLPYVGLGGNIAYVNMDAWNALGPELQKKVQDYVDSNIMEVNEWLARDEEKALAAAKEYGVEFITLSDADVARFNEVQRKYWDKIGEKSPLSAECVQLNRDFVKSKGG